MSDTPDSPESVSASITKTIQQLKASDPASLEECQAILKDVLNSLSGHLSTLPDSERRATFSLLYKQIADVIFDLHLAILVMEAKTGIASAPSVEQRHAVLHKFRGAASDLAFLHGV